MGTWREDFEKALDEVDTKGSDEPTEFTPLPNGQYTMILQDVTTEANPNDGIMRTSLEFEVVEGEHQGRKVWEKVKHSDSLLWKIAKLYRGLQLEGELDGFDDFARTAGQEKGRQFVVNTKNREYDGKTYTNVDRVTALPNDAVPF